MCFKWHFEQKKKEGHEHRKAGECGSGGCVFIFGFEVGEKRMARSYTEC